MRLPHLARASGIVLAGNLVSSTSSFLLAVVVAREFGPAGRGELAAFVLVPLIVSTFLTFGLPVAHSYWGGKRPELLGAFAWNGLLTSAVVGAVVGVVAVAGMVGEGLPVVGRLQRPVLALAGIPLQMAVLLMGELLPAQRRFGAYAGVRASFGFLPLLAVVGALGAGRDTLGTAQGMIVAGWAGAALLAMGSQLPLLARSAPAASAYLVALRYTVLIGPSLVLQMVNYRLDQLLLAALLPRTALGLYAASVSLAEAVHLPAAAAATVLLPEVARRGPRGARDLVRRTVPAGVAFTTGTALLIGLLARPLLSLLFGSPFATGAPVLRVLALSIPAVALTKLMGAALAGIDRQAANLRAIAASAAASVLLVPVLIVWLGPVGAAWASLGAYSVTAAIQLRGWSR